VFPLADGKSYQITSTLRADGKYQLVVDDRLVGSLKVRNAHPISFRIKPGSRFPPSSGWGTLEFKGDDFPLVWRPGYAGILVEPLDNGKNIASELRFAPGIIKLKLKTKADF